MSLIKLPSIANFKLRTKLLVLSSFLVLIAITTGGSGLYFITNISNSINDLSDIASPLVKETTKMVKSMDDAQTSVSARIEADSVIDAEDMNQLLQEFDKVSELSLSTIVKLLKLNGEQLDVSNATKAREGYIKAVDREVAGKNNIVQLQSDLKRVNARIYNKRQIMLKRLELITSGNA